MQNYLGFHQSDLIYQSIYELIHKDDRAAFHCQLHDAVPDGCSAAGSPSHHCPEHSGCMERSFTCRLHCLLDNSSGFLALNFHGRLKLLLGQQKRASDTPLGPLPLALFAIVTHLQPFSILEFRTKMLFFQSKHKLDFTPIACDSRYGISCLNRGKTHGHKCRTESQSATGCPCLVLCPQGEGHPGLHRGGAVHERVWVPVCAHSRHDVLCGEPFEK
ncbi:aryl hydrocarbon receptor-like [Numida meleagris]|uniref:aryl hydrocarbon receptor-like n=1 Tax=Numida meleagris TaxID=8996 RepID=UPI000B3E3257|nr:aryl hydrocarbon receptor-like [Numida meleagris]